MNNRWEADMEAAAERFEAAEEALKEASGLVYYSTAPVEAALGRLIEAAPANGGRLAPRRRICRI